MKRASIFLIVAALIGGTVGCGSESYTLTIASTSGGSVVEPGEGTFTYNATTVVDLVAEANEGHYFVDWTGDASTIGNVNSPITTITIQDNYAITANFEQIPPGQFVLTIYSTTGGSVMTPGEGTSTYDEGTMVNLVAQPDEGYHFVNWTGDVGTIADVEDVSTTITMSGDYSITANFAEIPVVQYQLAINSTEGGLVTIPGEGVFLYNEGTVVSLVAVADEGYHFLEWTGNVSTIADVYADNTTITVNGDYVSTAVFNEDVYDDFSVLLDYAIISYGTIDIQPGNMVDGDVWLPDEEDLEVSPGAVITGDVKDNDDLSITWPTAGQLSAYYYDDVEGTYDPGPSIDVEYTKVIGPCYRDGDLVVDNTGDPDTLVLEGTIYVTGDLEFWQSGTSHDYTVDLNGHTIFAEGSISFPSLVVGISGPGCIIAVGYIDFQPSIAGDDFVLVMSITDAVNFNPSDDFTGCVAGNVHVQVQPNCIISWISPEGKGLNFPGPC